MVEDVRARVAEKLKELDGVVALRQTSEGTAPHLFQDGDDLSQLVLDPRYPLATTISLLQKRYPEAAAELVYGRPGGNSGTNRCGGYYIVSAGVSNFGQGIVFGEKGDIRPPGAIASPESGGELADTPLHLEALPPQIVSQPG